MRKTIQITYHILVIGLIGLYSCQTHKQITRQADTASSEEKMGHYEYINKYKDIAIQKMHKYGIPASITLAQGILESQYGNSRLAREAHNHFGIKCNENWDGPVVYKNDDNINDCFRKYRTAKHSYRDHSKYLTSRSRYDHLFDLPTTAYQKWAKGLQKAGYATNPSYANLLIKLIEKYHLHRFDAPQQKEMGSQTTKTASAQNHYQVFEHNRVETIKAQQDDTPLKIANRFDIPLQRLLQYNDLKKSQPLQKGQFFYLQPKRRNNWNHKFHIIRPGETMREISQKYGVKLDLLYKRNNLPKGAQPAIDEKVYINQRRKDTIQTRALSPPNNKTNNDHYIVKDGDTLYSIAQKYRITVDKLKKINNLHSNNIEPGQKLMIK